MRLLGPGENGSVSIGEARTQGFLSVLDRSLLRQPTPLGTQCSEGPAVSRRRLHIAWTHVAAQYPDEMPAGSSRMQEADLAIENGKASFVNQRLILASRDLPFTCTLETQNFRPPGEIELTFSAYGQHTLVECNKLNLQGSGHVDLWKLKRDGTEYVERLTFFSDTPGYKASNPVVSDDGKRIAFQLAVSREAAGVGHGIFILDPTAHWQGTH